MCRTVGLVSPDLSGARSYIEYKIGWLRNTVAGKRGDQISTDVLIFAKP